MTASLFLLPCKKASASGVTKESPIAVYDAPETLSYKEIASIDSPAGVPATLKLKLDALMVTPFVSNEAHLSNSAREPRQSDKLGEFIRVGFWNIERGLRLDEIKMAIENPDQFKQQIEATPDSDEYREIAEQIEVLRSVDVLALNEVDLGVKRTGYKDVARELAAALKMNYVYGVEFIEIDPLNLGSETFGEVSPGETMVALRRLIDIDRERYQGLHGNAILSRFPITRARLVPLKCRPYDWLAHEKMRVSVAETARRQLSKIAFQQHTPREIRYGGRAALIAELQVPQLEGGRLTVVATHLEYRCKPSERRRQMQEVLSLIKEIDGPVVLAGDMNTTGSSLKPTTFTNELSKRVRNLNFWASQTIKAFTPFGLAFDFTVASALFAHTAADPTASGIYLLGPNKEAELFRDIERFRFRDGFAFDFRGDPERTINRTSGTLANSNQRARKKGFISTHAMKRTYWAVGKSKLDWIFVKAYAKNPRSKTEPYRLAPHFARTLEKLNYGLGYRISDHNPITVDLPLGEPRL
ncbi:MAG TPA: endonuclease/exonuclease/phosphatase family protein [Blastocatellia bacterium]|nr:endonuclease/exonuclease/phosphatase family protein [Blastocatellia bacterium]